MRAEPMEDKRRVIAEAIHLEPGDHIITAYAEPASGPGWSNSPVWVIVQGVNGKMRRECIQPLEQTGPMSILYNVSSAAHASMTQAVRMAVAQEGGPANPPHRERVGHRAARQGGG
jgi:hypothetical protein